MFLKPTAERIVHHPNTAVFRDFEIARELINLGLLSYAPAGK